jgi:hypothetical protein
VSVIVVCVKVKVKVKVSESESESESGRVSWGGWGYIDIKSRSEIHSVQWFYPIIE